MNDSKKKRNLEEKYLQAFDLAAALSEQKHSGQERMRAFLLELLEVVDGLDRFLQEEQKQRSPAESLRGSATLALIRRQFMNALKKQGVDAVPITLGSDVDPDIHQVVGTIAVDTDQDEQILEVILPGYRWNGKPLRRPRVLTSKTDREV